MDTNNKMSTNNRLLDDNYWKSYQGYYWKIQDEKLIYIGPQNHTFFLSRDRKQIDRDGYTYIPGPLLLS
jgi:hypothetical protein